MLPIVNHHFCCLHVTESATKGGTVTTLYCRWPFFSWSTSVFLLRPMILIFFLPFQLLALDTFLKNSSSGCLHLIKWIFWGAASTVRLKVDSNVKWCVHLNLVPLNCLIYRWKFSVGECNLQNTIELVKFTIFMTLPFRLPNFLRNRYYYVVLVNRLSLWAICIVLSF